MPRYQRADLPRSDCKQTRQTKPQRAFAGILVWKRVFRSERRSEVWFRPLKVNTSRLSYSFAITSTGSITEALHAGYKAPTRLPTIAILTAVATQPRLNSNARSNNLL